MDYLQARRLKEFTLLTLVGLTAVVANLPSDVLLARGLEPRYLLAVLGILVLLALFLYVRFFFFLLYCLLAVGANLPDQWAEGLGIARLPMLIALGVMVVFSLLNFALKVVPSGLDANVRRRRSPEGIKALVHAVERENLGAVRQLLRMNIDINVVDDSGLTPLMVAAVKGQLVMVGLMLKQGADPAMVGREGLTALELAIRHGQNQVVELLRSVRDRAREEAAAPPVQTEPVLN